jgi:hypothetical protein
MSDEMAQTDDLNPAGNFACNCPIVRTKHHDFLCRQGRSRAKHRSGKKKRDWRLAYRALAFGIRAN